MKKKVKLKNRKENIREHFIIEMENYGGGGLRKRG